MIAKLRSLAARLVDWTLRAEGSTRGLGLIRIGVALMLWARFGDFFGVYTDSTTSELVLTALFFTSTTLMLVGLFTRPAVAVAALVLGAGFYELYETGWRSQNLQLLIITTAVLALTPCGRSYSVDRRLALARAERRGQAPPLERAPLWSMRLLCMLICSVYLGTAIDKTSWAFLSGERLASIFGSHYTGSAYLDGWAWESTMLVGAVGVWLLEWVLVFGLFVPRLRKLLTVAGAVLHASFYAMFRVYTFSANMLLLYLAFYDQDGVAEAIDRLCPTTSAATSTTTLAPTSGARRIARATCMVAILAVVIGASVVDLRHDSPAPGQPAVELLEDRWSTFVPTKAEEKQVRGRETRRETPTWRKPKKRIKKKNKKRKNKKRSQPKRKRTTKTP